MEISEKLAKNVFKQAKDSHIALDQGICLNCKERFCVYCCPGNLYSQAENGQIVNEHAGCLECGACLAACTYGAIKWTYPAGEFGVQYRFG